MKKRLFILLGSIFFSLLSFSQSFKELDEQLQYLLSKGEYEKAIPVAEKASEAAKKEFGEFNPTYVTAINTLADLYTETYRYEKAEPLYKRVTEILLQELGEKHQYYAMSLHTLARYYSVTGRYLQAEQLLLKANAIRKETLGTEHPDYALGLNDLSVAYSNLGRYEKAEPLLAEASEIYRRIKGEEDPEYVISLNNLAATYTDLGLYSKAEPLYLQAMAIREKVLGREHPDFTSSLNNLAFFYAERAEYEKALPLYLEAIDTRKKLLGENHPDYANSLNNLAKLYADMGQYEKAEPLYLQAVEITRLTAGKDHPLYAIGINNLALLNLQMGQYVKAENFLKECIVIRKKALGELHPDYASALNNLAGLYLDTKEYTKAEPLFVQAKTIREKIYEANHPELAESNNNLANLYLESGDTIKAEPLFKQSAEIRKSFYGENHPDYANGINNLAGFYEAVGNFRKAESLYTQAGEIWKKTLGENHPVYATSLDNLSKLYAYTGREKEAAELAIMNTRVVLRTLMRSFTVLSAEEKENYLYQNTSVIDNNNSLLYYGSIVSSGLLRRENYNLQVLLKSLALSDTRNILSSIRNSTDSAIKNLFVRWQESKAILSKQYSLPLKNRRPDLQEVERTAELYEKDLNRKSSLYQNQENANAVSIKTIHSAQQPEETIVEYIRFRLFNKKWTDSTIYAAYILNKKDTTPVFVPLFEERQLQKILDSAGTNATDLVNNIYRGLEGKGKSDGALGAELYQLLWAPLEPYLKGIKKVSYSPAGKLYGIAFHALPADSNTLLMDKYELQQYTSTRQVALRKEQETRNKIQEITLFGDAAFTMDSITMANSKVKSQNASGIYTPPNRGNRGSNWASLPGTGEEVKKIKSLFEINKISSQSFVQTTASEENLKALSGKSPQVLHIATHGFFLPEPAKKKKENLASSENSYTLAEDPLLRSGLILAGGNYAWSGKTPIEGVEDGIATAYEISQLDLSKTELVVLSACETALGDVKGSEGVFGLQRAFKMAGVKKMIVSLWQVPDKETAELMTAFYSYWLKGQTIEQAFARAQSDMRKKYPPYYWAAFVLVE